jgi:hypothetical protein
MVDFTALSEVEELCNDTNYISTDICNIRRRGNDDEIDDEIDETVENKPMSYRQSVRLIHVFPAFRDCGVQYFTQESSFVSSSMSSSSASKYRLDMRGEKRFVKLK